MIVAKNRNLGYITAKGNLLGLSGETETDVDIQPIDTSYKTADEFAEGANHGFWAAATTTTILTFIGTIFMWAIQE